MALPQPVTPSMLRLLILPKCRCIRDGGRILGRQQIYRSGSSLLNRRCSLKFVDRIIEKW